MASIALRLRRVLSPFSNGRVYSAAYASTTTGAPLLRTPIIGPPPSQTATACTAVAFLSFFPSSQFDRRALHSTSISLYSSRSSFDDQKFDDNEPLFEGCDYKHWLITMDFPEPKPSPEEMVETYVQTLAKVVGSVDEAKKRMYACSTTTYNGFQAEIDEETAQKFEGMPGVVFVLPDSYIDPVNKEYGGDKYINGTIIPRPPPVQYGRPRQRRDRGGMQGDGRSSMQQNYASMQNNGPPQNYPPQSNYGPPGNIPPRSTYGPSGNYPPRANYNPSGYNPPQANYNPSGYNPPQANYAPSENANPATLGNANHVPLGTSNLAPSGYPSLAPPGNHPSQQYSALPGQGDKRNYMPTYEGDYPVGGRENYQGVRSTSVAHHQGYQNQSYQPPHGQRGYPPGQQNWSGQTSFAEEKYAPPPPSQRPYGHGGVESYGHGNVGSYRPGEAHQQGAGSGYGPGYTEYGANKGFAEPQSGGQDEQKNYEAVRRNGMNQRY